MKGLFKTVNGLDDKKVCFKSSLLAVLFMIGLCIVIQCHCMYVCVGVRISSLQSREEGGGSRGQGKQETLDGFVKQPSTAVRIYTLPAVDIYCTIS